MLDDISVTSEMKRSNRRVLADQFFFVLAQAQGLTPTRTSLALFFRLVAF
jgi:hypothetical protein